MNKTIQSNLTKNHKLFTLNFKEHVHHFIREHQLIHPNKKIALAVSGGVDSMALLDIFGSLGIRFEVIHFNHGTRPVANENEESLVAVRSALIGVKFNLFRFNFSLNEKNFEKKAREERRKVFTQFLKNNYWVYTAHHIDDSFEWSLMQTFRQGGVKSNLGIPVFNHGIVRPFMCVTKKQILRYAHAKKLEWREDASNLDEKFERNHLRAQVTKGILKRYPSALKHYVSRHNQLAHLNGVHRNRTLADLVMTKLDCGGVVLKSANFKKYKSEIKEWIHACSDKTRGVVDLEVDKLISAHQEIMKDPKIFPFKGPMNFSGGVTVFVLKDQIFIGGQKELNFYRTLDLQLKSDLEKMTQIPWSAVFPHFPFLVITNGQKLQRNSKVLHPLLLFTCEWLKKNGISYTFAPLLGPRDRQMLTEGAVILDSSVRGL